MPTVPASMNAGSHLNRTNDIRGRLFRSGARIFERILVIRTRAGRPVGYSGKEGDAMKKSVIVAVVSALVLGGAAGFVAAQEPPPIKRIPLQKYETVVGIAEIAPNVLIGRHTHPGPESGYLLEGEFVLMIDGQPPKPLKAGESYQVPSGAIHDAKAAQAAPSLGGIVAKASRWRLGQRHR
jgi:quercetin dioxygenase-like cupin family protein